jgi:hypothetical protein
LYNRYEPIENVVIETIAIITRATKEKTFDPVLNGKRKLDA